MYLSSSYSTNPWSSPHIGIHQAIYPQCRGECNHVEA